MIRAAPTWLVVVYSSADFRTISLAGEFDIGRFCNARSYIHFLFKLLSEDPSVFDQLEEAALTR